MFKRLGNLITDWLYENILGSTRPTLSAQTSPERLREIKLRMHGVDPATGRKVQPGGSPGDGGGPSNAPGMT